MGQAEIGVDAMASAAPFSHQGGPSLGLAPQANADPGDVGHAPAGLLVPANGALSFSNAAQLDRFALPAVKAKDPVRLANGEPTLQVVQGTAGLGSRLDMGPVEWGGQGGGLAGGQQARGACWAWRRQFGELGAGWLFNLGFGRSPSFWPAQELQCRWHLACPGPRGWPGAVAVAVGHGAGHGLVWNGRR